MRVLLTFLFVFLLAGTAVHGQTPVLDAVAVAPAAPERRAFEEIYLAKDDGKGKPGVAASEFAVSDVPIHCVVRLAGSAQVTVRMNLVAADVAGVKPETRVVSSSYTTKENQDRVYFLGKPERLWTPGKYRADVYINDILVNKLEFDIRGPAVPVKSALGFQPKQPQKARRNKRN